MKILTSFSFLFLVLSSAVFAKNCPEKTGKYGDEIMFQDLFCQIKVSTDKNSRRDISITDSGQIQIFSNFAGTTNSNSTGARVYYLFPIRGDKKIISNDDSQLDVIHPSNVHFKFDRNGKLSSPDLKMKVSADVNSTNKSGVEIENYPNGIIIDIGYRKGSSPITNKAAVVTVTDKNNKKCSFPNSEFHRMKDGEAELVYKSNESLHKFLSQKCSNLDLSDLMSPINESLKAIVSTKDFGHAPAEKNNLGADDSKRASKPAAKTLEDLQREISEEAAQGLSR